MAARGGRHLQGLRNRGLQARQVAGQRAKTAERERALDAAGVPNLHDAVECGLQWRVPAHSSVS